MPAHRHPSPNHRRLRHAGFTLIEVAVVLLIASLLLVGGLNIINATRTNIGLTDTRERIDILAQALQMYLLRNNRLPCPADPTLAPDAANYTLADINDLDDIDNPCDPLREIGTTGLYWGTLPYRTLELAPGPHTDGWDNQYFYVVNGGATVTDSLYAARWNHESSITVFDRATAPPARQLLVPNGVFALLSAGPNARGAYRLNGVRQEEPLATSLEERDNQDADNEFAAAAYSESTTRPFDDIVQVYTEDQIFAPLVANGLLQTKHAFTTTRMAAIVQTILGYAAAITADPDGVPRISTPPAVPADHVPPCVFAPAPVPAQPAGFHYPCTAGLRRSQRAIPRADSNGDGAGDTTASGLVPYADLDLAASEVVDGWGTALRYDPGARASATVPTFNGGIYPDNDEDPALVLRSFGPDGVDGTADDIVLSYSATELTGMLARAGVTLD